VDRHRKALVALVLVVVLAPACVSQNPAADTENPGPTVTLPSPGAAGGPTVSGDVNVYASPELSSVGARMAKAFQKQNPKARVNFVAENPKETILRILSKQKVDVFIADHRTLILANAYIRGDFPTPGSFAREALVLVTPKGNPAGIKSYTDLGDPPPAESVCTPPFMRLESANPLDSLAVPVNEASPTDCGATTVAKVESGDLKGALVPGSSVGFFQSSKVDRLGVPLTGNLIVPYGLANISGTNAATGYANFVRSDQGRQVLSESGYS
jgi:molybdate transport system substrate-binding protein